MSFQMTSQFKGPYRQQLPSSEQVSNRDINPLNMEIQLRLSHQNIDQIQHFDVKEIYANKEVSQHIKHRSDFIFLLPVIQRGSRHLIAIEKSQIIWTILKLIILTAICFYLNTWIEKLDNLSPFIKNSYLYTLRFLPILLLIVMMLDPGFILDHEIYENEYESTDDKRRPKDGRYCERCKLFVRISTGHCYKCNHCVSHFDHHCGVMTRCVGRTNAVPFYAFALLANFIYMGTVILLIYQWVFV